ncbi:MAG: hypothetical protein AAGH53_09205 [Pseudomonadota bacterium]
MTIEAKFSAASKLMLLNFAGIVALLIMEVIKAGGDISADILMPIAILMSIAALPIIVTAISTATWARWTGIVLTALWALFHGYHIAAEHGPAGDTAETILIVFTMLLPSALAAWVLFTASKRLG